MTALARISALVVLALLLELVSSVQAAERVALVIGNGDYRNVPRLPNPGNDATDVAASLQRLGFSVATVRDGSFDDMRRALLRFGREAAGADMAVMYFAGHGMEIRGENWLIPDRLCLCGKWLVIDRQFRAGTKKECASPFDCRSAVTISGGRGSFRCSCRCHARR